MSQVDKISSIVRDIEKNVPECQVDVELNTLEDAYVKIAEDEIAQNEENNTSEPGQSTRDEEADFL